MTIMAKKKKKKGRPSLLDLQKRSLKHQHESSSFPIRSPKPFEFSPNPSARSEIAGEDDDERKEKKHRLVLGLNSESEANRATLSFNSSADEFEREDRGVSCKRRKISVVSHGSDDMKGVKVLKATDFRVVLHGSQVESGPTATPLPNKKLLVFILDRLQKKDTYGVFSDPVDPEELPDYHQIIANPMDFGTVRKRLDRGAYSSLEQFEKDVLLICTNAMQYNKPDTIYFRQAKSMQEIAKKDFGNLREESEDSEPSPPKIVRRGRPPGKKTKKLTESSPFDCVEENENHNGYNLRKNPVSNKFFAADSVNASFHVYPGAGNYPSWVSEWESEFPASVIRKVQKYGMKHADVDENKRDSYRLSLAAEDEPSSMAVLDGEQRHLVEVSDSYSGLSYATSLARFAEDLGPEVWRIALKKIEASRNQESLFSEPSKVTILPQMSSCSNVIRENTTLQPCTNVSSSDRSSYNHPQVPVFPQMPGIGSNESGFFADASRLDSGSEFGTVWDESLQGFGTDNNVGFWTPDSPQHPDLALQLRMGW